MWLKVMKSLFSSYLTIVVLSIIPVFLHAQLPEHVASLLNTEKTAIHISGSESPHAALSYMIDKESSFYVPSLVNAQDYLKNRPNIPDVLTWKPTLALVAKSHNWGVTAGSMQFQRVGAIKRYGNYLTVWRRDKKGRWKIHIRAEVENYGKDEEKKLAYLEPDDSWYLKHRSRVRLGQREEVVMQSDELMSTVLKANNETAFNEFLDDDIRYFYPWTEELHGKNNVLNFLKERRIEIVTSPSDVGRAYSGEFAYTAGTATVTSLVDKEPRATKFNYVRVWRLNDDYNWKVMIELMFER